MSKRGVKELKNVDRRILAALMKNSRLSDRQLAKVLGVSQPTVTRRRATLEEEGFLEYSAIPNFRKLDLEILAFTFAKWKRNLYSDEKVDSARKFLEQHPTMLFVSTGMGLSWDRICISLHRDYSEYSQFISELKEEWEKYMDDIDSFIVSSKSDNILRDLSFKHLARLIEDGEIDNPSETGDPERSSGKKTP